MIEAKVIQKFESQPHKKKDETVRLDVKYGTNGDQQLMPFLPSRCMGRAGRVYPIIDSTFPLERVADAHRRMESNASFGKIVLAL